jgi:hypothetical protein
MARKMRLRRHMSQEISCTPDHLLASTADLAGLLAQFTDPRPSRRLERRHGQLPHTALSYSLQDTSRANHPRRPDAVAEAAVIPGAQKTSNPRSVPVGTEYNCTRIRERRYCQCGQCKWCLDNARWERIFNEKFLDPTYYSGLSVRHSSTLAQARR